MHFWYIEETIPVPGQVIFSDRLLDSDRWETYYQLMQCVIKVCVCVFVCMCVHLCASACMCMCVWNIPVTFLNCSCFFGDLSLALCFANNFAGCSLMASKDLLRLRSGIQQPWVQSSLRSLLAGAGSVAEWAKTSLQCRVELVCCIRFAV